MMNKIVMSTLILLLLVGACKEDIVQPTSFTNVFFGSWKVEGDSTQFNTFSYISMTRYLQFSNDNSVTLMGEDISRYRKSYTTTFVTDSLLTIRNPDYPEYPLQYRFKVQGDLIQLRRTYESATSLTLHRDPNQTNQNSWTPPLTPIDSVSLDSLHLYYDDGISYAVFDYGIWVNARNRLDLIGFDGKIRKDFPDSGITTGLCNHRDDLWRSDISGTIYRVDTANGSGKDSVKLALSANTSLWGFDRGFYYGEIYAGLSVLQGSFESEKIGVYDATGKLQREIPYWNSADRAVVCQFPQYQNYLLLGYLSHLYVVDPVTGNALGSYHTPFNVINAVAVRDSDGSIWMGDTHKIYRVKLPSRS